MKRIITAISILAAVSAQAAIIADLDVDWETWQTGGPEMTTTGWAFQWNESGQTLASGIRANLPAVGGWSYRESNSTTDASVDYTSTQPVSINDGDPSVGNIYGGKNSFLSADGNTHYMITSYTVQTGEAGTADIISSSSAGTASELIMLLNGAVLDSRVGQGGTLAFTAEDVVLAEGDIVSFAYANLMQDQDAGAANYVADLTAVNKNTTRLYAQYQIDVIPEPATLGLVAAFGGGILFIRRRFMI